jgi:hypothetical protein
MPGRAPKLTYIAAGKLAFGDQFKIHSRLRVRHMVHWTQVIQSGPMSGKILVMTQKKRPFFLDPDSQVVHCNPQKSRLPESLQSRLPKSLELLSQQELQDRLLLRTKQICQDTDLSSHLVDLLTQEISLIQEELEARKSRPFHQVFMYAKKLDKLMEKDIKSEGRGVTPKHERAKALLSHVLTKAQSNPEYASKCLTWMEAGGTRALKHDLLSPLGYDDEQMTDFDAFVLIDDLGIHLRQGKKALLKAKRKALRKEAGNG